MLPNSWKVCSLPSVPQTGKDAPQILFSVLGPSLQERCWGAGAHSEKSNEAGEDSKD